MKKRNLITTIISILCICSLLAANLTNGPAIISKASENGPVEQKTPEEMGYERLTVEDFNISAATHSATAYGSYGSDTGASALNGKYLDVNVQVSSAVDSDNETRISYGGYGGDGGGAYWWGLRVAIYAKSIYFGMAVNKSTAGAYTIALPEGVSATDKLNLKIATNVVGEDLQVDVWLNDVRQERMTFTGCAGEMGNYLGFIVSEPSITIGIPDAPKPTVEQKTPEDMGYERLTIEDFNISAATHSATASGSYGSDTGASALNGKYLDVNVQVSSAVDSDNATRISYGGGGDGVYWWGLRAAILVDSIYFAMAVNNGTAGAYAIALPEGVSATDKLNLKIATNVVGADLQVDVWLNDVRQERMTFTGCAGEMGNWLGFIVSEDNTFTISTPDVLKVKEYSSADYKSYRSKAGTPEAMGYERLTIEDFNISAATHSATASGSYGSDTGASALNGKYLDVNVQVSSAVSSDEETRISYGGGGAGVYWWGLRVAIYEKSIYFGMAVNKGTAGAYSIRLPEGVSATDEMNLKIATNVVGEDLQVDVWLNDVRQERMTFTGCAGEMGNYLGFIVSGPSITISTPKHLEKPTYTAPVEDGYLFAGWYADEACTKPFAEKTAEQNVYAKFVPKSVFTVKAQITAGLQETDEMGDIRFLTTVESKNYAKVGFDITIEGFEKQTIPFTTVYKQLYMVSVNPETEEKTLDTIDAQEEFSSLSKYFVAYAYWNVPNTAFGSEFTVTPWWVTEDGTLVYGETVTKSVSEGITKQNGGVEPYVAL